jgi:hypothetical protein
VSRFEQRTPLVTGGISRQPEHARLPNQVADAVNAQFSVVNGITKRRGSWHIAYVGEYPADTDLRMHAINRDQGEQYLLVYGAGVVRAFRVGGTEATVGSSAEATTYLGTTGGSDLRLLTIADYTLILNTDVATTTQASPSYTVDKVFRDFDTLTSWTPTNQTYHRTNKDTDTTPKGYYYYDTTGGTFATWVSAGLSGTQASVTGDYDDGDKNPGGFTITCRAGVSISGAAWNATNKTITKTGAFAFGTFQSGDTINVTGGTGWTPGSYTISSHNSDDQITLSVAAGQPGSNNTDTAINQINVARAVIADFTTVTLTTMEDVALEFQRAARSSGLPDLCVAWNETGSGTGTFIVTGQYRGSGSTIVSFAAPPAGNYDWSSAGRPFNGGTVTAGTGSPSSPVKPVLDRWNRIAGPGQTNAAFRKSTMPITLRRTTVSSNPGIPSTFDLGVTDWSDRTSGDDDTNPPVSFLRESSALTDIAFYRDRLVLTSGEKIAMSQTGDLFNFWIGDANNIVDSDPIDISLASEEVTSIEFAVPFRKTLVLFTLAGRQFEIASNDELTASKVSATPTTVYKTQPARPHRLDSQLYFAANSNDYATLMEYVYDDVRVASAAEDVGIHIPGLIPPNIIAIETFQNDQAVVVLPSGGNTLYVYEMFRQADGTKQQSSWTKFVFDECYTIKDIASIDSYCYMLVECDGQWSIERFSLSEPSEGEDLASDVSSDYPIEPDEAVASAFTEATWDLETTLSVSPVYADVFVDSTYYDPSCTICSAGAFPLSAGSCPCCPSTYDYYDGLGVLVVLPLCRCEQLGDVDPNFDYYNCCWDNGTYNATGGPYAC